MPSRTDTSPKEAKCFSRDIKIPREVLQPSALIQPLLCFHGSQRRSKDSSTLISVSDSGQCRTCSLLC